jgi:transposase, IS5 family
LKRLPKIGRVTSKDGSALAAESGQVEHRAGRNCVAHTQGDAANAVLAAAGYNFRRLLAWLALLCALLLDALRRADASENHPVAA